MKNNFICTGAAAHFHEGGGKGSPKKMYTAQIAPAVYSSTRWRVNGGEDAPHGDAPR